MSKSVLPLRVTLRSHLNDLPGIRAWIEENRLGNHVFLVELVEEGQALISRWARAWWDDARGPVPVLLCACGGFMCADGGLKQMIYIHERVPIRSLPPQACLESGSTRDAVGGARQSDGIRIKAERG